MILRIISYNIHTTVTFYLATATASEPERGIVLITCVCLSARLCEMVTGVVMKHSE